MRTPGLALGIGRTSTGEHRLELRLEQEDSLTLRWASEAGRLARGEADVRFVGRIRKLSGPWHRERQRPLLIGTSIGHAAVTAGTLGCFVSRPRSADAHVLSNNHVLANEDRAVVGDDVMQPGRADGGGALDVIGSLASAVPLDHRGVNHVDAAVARLRSDVTYEPSTLRTVGTLAGLSDPDAAPDVVEKIGRTTGHTAGRVTAFELDDVQVEFDTGTLRFDGQIEIEGSGSAPFSAGGDSGSLIFDEGRRAAALLFAGSDTGGANGAGLTYANPIHTVLSALGATLLR